MANELAPFTPKGSRITLDPSTLNTASEIPHPPSPLYEPAAGFGFIEKHPPDPETIGVDVGEAEEVGVGVAFDALEAVPEY